MNYVVDKVKEEQKEDVSILTHPPGGEATNGLRHTEFTERYC